MTNLGMALHIAHITSTREVRRRAGMVGREQARGALALGIDVCTLLYLLHCEESMSAHFGQKKVRTQLSYCALVYCVTLAELLAGSRLIRNRTAVAEHGHEHSFLWPMRKEMGKQW